MGQPDDFKLIKQIVAAGAGSGASPTVVTRAAEVQMATSRQGE